MKTTLIILFLLASSAGLFYYLYPKSQNVQELTSAATTYTYYGFQRNWPPAECKLTSCNFMDDFDGKNFNLHGLWPSGSPSDACAEPHSCQKIAYDESQLSSSTLAKINQYWVGGWSSTKDFRTHEWNKHGTCWNDPSKQSSNLKKGSNVEEDFFKKVMDLNDQYNILTALAKQGIKPGSTPHKYNDYLNALAKSWGASTDQISLLCIKADGVSYFDGVNLCLDLNYKITDCPCKSALEAKEYGVGVPTPGQCPQKNDIILTPWE